MQKKKVLVGLSGGVDSSVAALCLLQAGFQVDGVFLKNWSSTAGLLKNDCPWLEDRRAALRTAAFLGIPIHTLDFEKEYQQYVMKEFFEEYKKGNTPNPDVLCNEFIKFGFLYDWAISRGYDYVATGHYAQILEVKGKNGKGKALAKSSDSFKDQTYFLYRIKQPHLEHILFPIGYMKKDEVKAIAKKAGLPSASRKESMGLCFVGKVRLKDFLSQKIKEKPGKILDFEGKVVGRHVGLANYTIGQRHGIQVAGKSGYYVCGKDVKRNILYVTDNPEDERLFSQTVKLKKCNWLVGLKNVDLRLQNSRLKKAEYHLQARYRHQGELVKARVVSIGANSATVEFADKQKALASGQSLVLYDGNVCLGGGIII